MGALKKLCEERDELIEHRMLNQHERDELIEAVKTIVTFHAWRTLGDADKGWIEWMMINLNRKGE